MGMKLYNEDDIQMIADAIREKNGKTDKYKVADMPQAILEIEGGGGRLPEEYQEVDFIEGTRTQYIKTGFIPNYQTKIECIYTPRSNVFVFGQEYDWQNKAYEFVSSSSNSLFSYGTSLKQFGALPWNNKYKVVCDKEKIYINDTLKATNTISSWQGSYELYLFTSNKRNAVISDGIGAMKLYSFKAYTADLLVRDYVPCIRKSDLKPGLYDLVNKTFTTNAGSGEFIAGND